MAWQYTATSKEQTVNILGYLKVISQTKKDGSIFHFFENGKCNFEIASPIKHNPIEPNYNDTFNEAKEEYYNELVESVCEYCGDYGCDYQRDLDEFNDRD